MKRFHSFSQFASLVFFHVRAVFFNLKEELRFFVKYSSHLDFVITSLLFLFFYIFKSPYKYAPNFGETPISTFDAIAKACRLQSSDCFIDLGCGRAKGLFWLSSFVGCKTIGVERIPTFVRKAQSIQKIIGEKKITLLQGDLFHAELDKADVIYLYGTLMEEEEITQLIARFGSLKSKTKIVTVSFPLTDFDTHPNFRLLKAFKGRFPWGKTTLYLQEKI